MKENDNFSVSRNSEVSAFPRRMSCLSSFAFYMDVSVQFSRSVLSDSLRPHGLQHSRPPCPSPAAGVYSNPCLLTRWCHPTISSSVIPFCPQSFPGIRVFSNELALCIRWPKYWSFSFSIRPSDEHPGLISFRMDWLDLLAVQGTLRAFSSTIVQKHRFFSA